MNFQDLILALNAFWKEKGCILLQGLDVEMGAGTFHPATFFKVLGKRPWKTAYVQPCRRPTDGRYGKNPFRAQHYFQYQVILKPSPDKVQELYFESLRHVGVRLKEHDVRFVEDDWESPTLGAQGLGWEVWLDSLEVTQFTYFQRIAGIDLEAIPCEITYGLERICMFLQGQYNLFKLEWCPGTSYGDLYRKSEEECSRYNFEQSDPKFLLELFNRYEGEVKRLLKEGLLSSAYDFVLKMSHVFNQLDARGAVSQVERPAFIGRVRGAAKACASLYLEREDETGA
ncbi:MAG: glycine--tRNA ligase subunit alpha [Candidatus Omnitrophica bacterium]|nr:glycine--tRNA ligase subunit alpha [Candidatus Omnitrophota bacterium]